MNKTKIDWCESTWNPVTGCYHNCEYCYAAKIAKRFEGYDFYQKQAPRSIMEIENNLHRVEKDRPFYKENVNTGKKYVAPYPFGFEPTFREDKLDEYVNKKGRAIFVCSMSDLFGDWVPDEWILEVFEACKKAPQHTYLFLTKNPKRYLELGKKDLLPKADNMWYGTTITHPEDPYFFSKNHNTFLSIEPILEDFTGEYLNFNKACTKWVILGAETGNQKNKVVPKKEWIDFISSCCEKEGVPLFMKESILPIVGGENFVQEYPWKTEK